MSMQGQPQARTVLNRGYSPGHGPTAASRTPATAWPLAQTIPRATWTVASVAAKAN